MLIFNPNEKHVPNNNNKAENPLISCLTAERHAVFHKHRH